MANGWLPTTASEFFEDVARKQRIAGRRVVVAYDDDTGAIDASTAPEPEPLDSFTEGLDDEFPVPVPPGVGDLPPDYIETADFGDSLPEEESPVVEAVVSGGTVGVAWVDSAVGPTCDGGSLNFSAMTYSAPIDTYVGLGGQSSVPVSSWVSVSGNEVILDDGWYEIDMWITLGWNAETDAPAAIGPYMYGPGGSGVFFSTWDMKPRVRFSSTKWGIQAHHHCGRVWMGDGDNSIFPDVFIPVAGSVVSTQGSVSWSITKLT